MKERLGYEKHGLPWPRLPDACERTKVLETHGDGLCLQAQARRCIPGRYTPNSLEIALYNRPWALWKDAGKR